MEFRGNAKFGTSVFIDRQTDMAYNPIRLVSSSLVMCIDQKKDNVTCRPSTVEKQTLRAKIPTFRRRTQDKSTAEVNEGLHKTA